MSSTARGAAARGDAALSFQPTAIAMAAPAMIEAMTRRRFTAIVPPHHPSRQLRLVLRGLGPELTRALAAAETDHATAEDDGVAGIDRAAGDGTDGIDRLRRRIAPRGRARDRGLTRELDLLLAVEPHRIGAIAGGALERG